MYGISSFGWIIISLVGAGESKIVNVSIHFYYYFLTNIFQYPGEIKSCCLNVRLFIVMPAKSVLKHVRLIGVSGVSLYK